MATGTDSNLQADVAAFVSGLGFTTNSVSFGQLGSGFNDSDFRKKGRIGTKRKAWSQQEKLEPEGNRRFASQERGVLRKKPSGKNKHKFDELLNEPKKKKPTIKKCPPEKKGFAINKSCAGKGNDSTLTERDFTPSTDKGPGNISSKASSKLLSKLFSVLESGPWYEGLMTLTNISKEMQSSTSKSPVPNGLRSKLVIEARKRGEALMEVVCAEFERSRSKNSDMRWVMMARRTGTTADKVAAFTVLIQDNPIVNLKALDALLGMVTTKGGKRHAATGIDALKELFIASLLPDRKLKYIAQQPVEAHQNLLEDERLVIFWYWEECLKYRYEQFVSSLVEAAKDKLPFLKTKAVKTIYELLESKPEQERRLLSALVNKLGDPERKVASNAGYYLSCLLTSHPNMKMVVVEEVDSFLFRPHLGLRSMYQAVVFLNQTVLSNRGDGPKLAKRLIDIYFSLFKVITSGELNNGVIKDHKRTTSKKSLKNSEKNTESLVEMDSRLLSALLTGVNRAFPFVAAEDIDILIQKHTPALFRLVHSENFNVGIQSLALLYQLLAKNHAVSDRLYRALYAVIFSSGLTKSTKMEMFLGLVFKVTKSDLNSKRMAAFAKRLMQAALQASPQFACGILLLLSEVLKLQPALWNGLSQVEDADEEIEHFDDIKEDTLTAEDEVLEPTSNGRNPSTFIGDEQGGVESSSESDEFKCAVSDIVDEYVSTSGEEGETVKQLEIQTPTFMEAGGWADFEGRQTTRWMPRSGYDPRSREPSFCNADRACWWELTILASHAHPSVAAMAKTLLSGGNILYKGNPFKDLTIGVFLDRFAEKKPKIRRKSSDWHGSSLAPIRKSTTSGNMLPIGSEFLELSEKEIAPDDIVFHKFYTNRRAKKMEVSKMKDGIMDDRYDDDDIVGDQSDDDEIEELLEQDEGLEMALDEFTEEDEDVSTDCVYSAEDEPFQESRNKSNIFEAKGKKKRKLDPNRVVTGRKEPSKRRKQMVFTSEGSKTSPFASLDDYSHLMDDESVEDGRLSVTRKKKKGM